MSRLSDYGVTRQLLAAAASSQVSGTFELPVPCTKFSLQVTAAASSAQVTLAGSLVPGTSATTVTLLSFSSNSAGVISTATTGPYKYVRAQLVEPGSSGGTSAWFSAAP